MSKKCFEKSYKSQKHVYRYEFQNLQKILHHSKIKRFWKYVLCKKNIRYSEKLWKLKIFPKLPKCTLFHSFIFLNISISRSFFSSPQFMNFSWLKFLKISKSSKELQKIVFKTAQLSNGSIHPFEISHKIFSNSDIYKNDRTSQTRGLPFSRPNEFVNVLVRGRFYQLWRQLLREKLEVAFINKRRALFKWLIRGPIVRLVHRQRCMTARRLHDDVFSASGRDLRATVSLRISRE